VRTEIEQLRTMLWCLDNAIAALREFKGSFEWEIRVLEQRRDGIGTELGTLEHAALRRPPCPK
jgi:hypothetical protein